MDSTHQRTAGWEETVETHICDSMVDDHSCESQFSHGAFHCFLATPHFAKIFHDQVRSIEGFGPSTYNFDHGGKNICDSLPLSAMTSKSGR